MEATEYEIIHYYKQIILSYHIDYSPPSSHIGDDDNTKYMCLSTPDVYDCDELTFIDQLD